jgi:predicted HAD superfamily hydrolase
MVTGYEGELTKRAGRLVSTIEEMIQRHKVISFDVFDTLLARRLETPTDVFRYLEKTNGPAGFSAGRLKAEEFARKRFGSLDSPEVSIEQIYQILGDLLPGLSIGPDEELAAELRFLCADPAVTMLVDMARAHGKPVIGISDIYLSATAIATLLGKNGIVLDRIYSSCDFREKGLGKFNGRIYPYVAKAENVDPTDILHFGDNAIADVKNAIDCAVTAVHIKSGRELVREQPGCYVPTQKGQSTLTSSLVMGQIGSKPPHYRSESSDLYAYGYCTAGPLLAGFCLFLANRTKEDGIERLVLLARDGYIIETALDILQLEVPPYSVMPISRRMVIFPLLKDDAALVDKFIFKFLSASNTPRAYWALLDLDPGLIAGREDVDRTMPRAGFLAAYNDELQAAADVEKDLLNRYLSDWLGDQPAKAALVDVGWLLSSIRALDQIIEPKYHGYFIGTLAEGYYRKGLVSYLFDRGEPAGIAPVLVNGLELIELIFSDSRPSFTRLKEESGVIVADCSRVKAIEQTRSSAVSDIRAGALGFIRDFSSIIRDVDPDELLEFNRAAFARLINEPTAVEYHALANVPHSAVVGHHMWGKVGGFWKLPRRTAGSDQLFEIPGSDDVARLQRYDLLVPSALQRLSERSDIADLNWRREMRRHPLKLLYWNAIRRYVRRVRSG